MLKVDGWTGDLGKWVMNPPLSVNTTHSFGGGLSKTLPLSIPWVAQFHPTKGAHQLVQPGCGAKLYNLKCGYIESTTLNSYNPCKHSKFDGMLAFVGANGENCCYPRVGSRMYASDWYTLGGSPAYVIRGRHSSRLNDPRLYDATGKLVAFSPTADNSFFWGPEYNIPPAFASPALRRTLPSGGVEMMPNVWYCRGVNGGFPSNISHRTQMFMYRQSRPTDTSFVLDVWLEFHTHDSYTPQSGIQDGKLNFVPGSVYDGTSPGIDYLQEAIHWRVTVTLNTLLSSANGVCAMTYHKKSECWWDGWQPWAEYNGETSEFEIALGTPVVILAPASKSWTKPDPRMANDYANFAMDRARYVYQASLMQRARTAAIQDVTSLDSNWIENLSQVGGILDTFNPLIQGWKAWKTKDPVAAIKAVSSAYLAYKYAIAPTISDAKDVKSNLGKLIDITRQGSFMSESRNGRISVFNAGYLDDMPVTARYTCMYLLTMKENWFSQLWAALERFGLEVSPANAWDLVPMSFVVDWFVRIGPALQWLTDLAGFRVTRDVTLRIEGFKAWYPLSATRLSQIFPGCISSGNSVSYSWYDRRVYSGLNGRDAVGSVDPISISLDSNGLSQSQMAQGAALTTQFLH